MSEKIKVALVGSGWGGIKHLDAYKKTERADIAGICTLDDKKEELEKNYSCPVFKDFTEMLDRVKPDTVCLCLPPHTHGDFEYTLIERGIPFFVEKPLANNLDLALDIASKIESAGIMTMVGYMYRYRESIVRAKDILKDQKISLACGGWICKAPASHAWLTRKDRSGGQLVEQSTHIVDLLRYFFGEFTEQKAVYTTGFREESETYKADDASCFTLKTESGTVATVLSSWTSGAHKRIFLDLLGPEIALRFSEWDFNLTITHADGAEETVKNEKNPFEIEADIWSRAVSEKNPGLILSDYADALKTLKITLSA